MANTYSIDLERSSSQSLSITDASQTGLDVSTAVTIEANVRLESNGIEQNIVGKYKYTGSNDRSYSFYINSSNYLVFGVSDDGTAAAGHFQEYTASTTALSTATWYHVVVTFDVATETCIFYVNGVAESSSKTSGTTLGASIYNGAATFYAGARDTGASNNFDGLINDLRVWNDVRTPSEIFLNLKRQLVGNESGLVGYWKLNNDLTDSTSNGNDLTNNNSAVFSTTVPFTNDYYRYFPTFGDGYVGYHGSGESWSTVRDATTGNVSDDSASIADARARKTGSDFQVRRVFIAFDTSDIGSKTIESAVLNATVDGANSSGTAVTVHAAGASQASTSALVAADYDNIARTSFGSDGYSGGASDEGFSITLNASGESNIQKSGTTKMSLQAANDLNDVEPTASDFANFYTSDETTLSKKPYLEVELSSAVSATGYMTLNTSYWGA